jgi:hypothetical protein
MQVLLVLRKQNCCDLFPAGLRLKVPEAHNTAFAGFFESKIIIRAAAGWEVSRTSRETPRPMRVHSESRITEANNLAADPAWR